MVRGKGVEVEEGNRQLGELIREREDIEWKIRPMKDKKSREGKGERVWSRC